jgi:hypothetical protein
MCTTEGQDYDHDYAYDYVRSNLILMTAGQVFVLHVQDLGVNRENPQTNKNAF